MPIESKASGWFNVKSRTRRERVHGSIATRVAEKSASSQGQCGTLQVRGRINPSRGSNRFWVVGSVRRTTHCERLQLSHVAISEERHTGLCNSRE